MSDPDDYERMLRDGVGPLGPRRRAGFAGICAERARALYESVTGDEDSDWFFDAMYFVWLVAMDKPIDRAELEAARDDARRRRDALIDAEDTGYMLAAHETLVAAMESVDDDGLESLISSAMSAVDAASQTTFDDDHGAEAEAEEEQFQRDVLAILARAPDQPVALGDFTPLGWKPGDGWPDPRWLTRLEMDERW